MRRSATASRETATSFLTVSPPTKVDLLRNPRVNHTSEAPWRQRSGGRGAGGRGRRLRGRRPESFNHAHGTWVAGPDLDPELYAAFLRGVIRAVRRIKADKLRYVSYFKEGWAAGDPEVQALTADDFNLGRIQLREPTPIPEDEARWAGDWIGRR